MSRPGMPGLAALVACGDDVHVDAIGAPSFVSGAAIARDAIFRIASLTKPVTAAATMSLVEEGILHLQRAEAALGRQSIGGPPWPPVAHDADSWISVLGSLGMTDTGFTVPAGQLSRLTTAYRPDSDTGELSVLDDPARSWWSTPPSFPDGSGWLVSTIDGYWTFVSMMLAGGTGRGERILSPATVALMTTDRLTSSQRDASALFLGEHGGWALGLGVPAAGSADQPLPCGIGWDAAPGPRGAPAPAAPSPGSCSPSARSRRRCLVSQSRTSGPASMPPPSPRSALRTSAQFPACDVRCAHPRAQKPENVNGG